MIILTITFWIGFFGAIFTYQKIKYTPQNAFVVSSENILYWKEEEETWDTKTLTQANEGYEVISHIIEGRIKMS